MAISTLMAWRAGYSGAVQALRVLNGTTLESTQLGAATGFTASGWDTGLDGPPRHSRIVEFRGDLYVYHNGTTGIYKFVFGSKTWSLVHTLSPAPNTGDDNTVSGFEVIEVNNEARLYLFYRQSLSTASHTRWSNDGSTWNSGAGPTSSLGVFFHRLQSYQGLIYATTGDNAGDSVRAYDPSGDTWSNVPVVGSAITTIPHVWINFKGRLLLIGPNANFSFQGLMTFKELVGGGLNDVTYSGGSDPGDMITAQASPRGSVFAFEDNDRLYVLFNEKLVNGAGNTAGQVRCTEFIPNGTAIGSTWQENDISSTVIPAAWRTGGAFANLFHENAAFMGYVDVTVPGTPEIFAWRYRDTSTIEQSTFWTWNGNGSPMTVVNSNVTAEVQVPSGPNMTGEHVYTEGDFDVTLENLVVTPGKISFDFQAHTPLDSSSPSTKQGRLFYTLGGTDWIQATLSTAGGDAPSVVSGGDPAPTISTNLLQGITVGSSVFRAVWDAVADGLVGVGEDVKLALEVF